MSADAFVVDDRDAERRHARVGSVERILTLTRLASGLPGITRARVRDRRDR